MEMQNQLVFFLQVICLKKNSVVAKLKKIKNSLVKEIKQ